MSLQGPLLWLVAAVVVVAIARQYWRLMRGPDNRPPHDDHPD